MSAVLKETLFIPKSEKLLVKIFTSRLSNVIPYRSSCWQVLWNKDFSKSLENNRVKYLICNVVSLEQIRR